VVVGSSPAAPAIPVRRPATNLESDPLVNRIRRFLDEAWSELKKVSWPTRDQVRNLTVLVFVISFVVGVYITVFDTLFSQAISLLAQ
jgi:preprotein translocase subunit SecE